MSGGVPAHTLQDAGNRKPIALEFSGRQRAVQQHRQPSLDHVRRQANRRRSPDKLGIVQVTRQIVGRQAQVNQFGVHAVAQGEPTANPPHALYVIAQSCRQRVQPRRHAARQSVGHPNLAHLAERPAA